MTKHVWLWLSIALLAASCEGKTPAPTLPPTLKVAILLAPSGKGDRSYNDMALAGAEAAKANTTFTSVSILPSRAADYESVLQALADDGTRLIVGVGFTYTEAITAVAPKYQHVSFLLVDGDAGAATNIRSIEFRPEEGSFIVGAVAARKTKTHRVGFIGGMEIPIIKRFECGFREGVKYIATQDNIQIAITTEFLGSTPEAFADPAKGRDVAKLMYSGGADVIYHAAGKSGNGIIQTALETGNYVIGVDTDQSYLAPKAVITSMRKRVDTVVARAIEDVSQGRFTSGKQSLGLAEGGLDWVVNPTPGTEHISPQLEQELRALSQRITSGDLKPCPPSRAGAK